MIVVQRLDGKPMVVNADHILTIESVPDTVLALTTGARLLVRDAPDSLIDKVVAFRRRCAVDRPEVVPPDTSTHPEEPAVTAAQD